MNVNVKTFLLAALLVTTGLRAQDPIAERSFLSLEAVDIGGGAMLGMDRTTGIRRADGFTSGAEVRARLSETFFISLGGGAGRLSILEDDPITNWNWGYWNRLYRNYIVLWVGSDSAYFNGQLQSLRAISNIRLTSGRWTGKDSLYSVHLTPRQSLNTYPISLTVGARWQLTEEFEVSGGFVVMAVPFERNLYLDESWSKRRRIDTGQDSGSIYVFSYSFRNFANTRRGTAWGIGATMSASVDLGAGFSAFGSARFVQFTNDLRPDSYTVLPFRRSVSIGAGLRVRY